VISLIYLLNTKSNISLKKINYFFSKHETQVTGHVLQTIHGTSDINVSE